MPKNHVTKLKNLILNSVDLCRTGANQKAHIRLKKSLGEEENEDMFNSLASAIFKTFGITETEKNVSKLTNTISEELFKGEEEKIKASMTESIKSILNDSSIELERKSEIIEKSVDEFFNTVSDFAKENKSDEEAERPEKSEGDEKVMPINEDVINKMTAEDKAVYEALMKKYNIGTIPGNKPEEDSQLNPDVQKALDDVKNKMAEIEQMKKSYEIKEMEAAAKKYEILGHKPEELAEKLYEYKKSNSGIYNDYIAILDEQLAMTKSLGIFNEIGNGRSGEGVEKQLKEKIEEIMKADTSLTYEQAFVKACDENDELRKSFE